ncbi:hypothetical protein B0A53_01428 [Rhodotorula sp. CCFEE 5036]|nr:hypothetical protein B0A53_01428 [Rhodotorula sp. CCFEE 5036]
MATLPELPAVTSLSKYVTRILGQNPSKFTLQGTNSYLVHHPHSTRMILIDTTGPSSSGPLPAAARSSYLTSLRSLLAERSTPQGGQGGAPAHVSDIILTHWHRDHVAALPDVIRALALVQPRIPVRVWKFPCADEGEEDWKSERGRDAAIEYELAGLGSTEFVVQPGEGAAGSKRIHVLRQGQKFRLESELRDHHRHDDDNDQAAAVSDADVDAIELEVVHTPGHTSDSICLVLRRAALSSSSAAAVDDSAAQTPPPLGVFTADTVLGHGTAVFASLSSYLSSLSRLITSLSSSSSSSPAASSSSSDPNPNTDSQPQLPRIPLFPGHGDVVVDAIAKITEYRAHRLERERQVVQVLERAQRDESGPLTADELVDQIYGSTIPSSLKPAATHGCLLHLAKLLEEKIVIRVVDTANNQRSAGRAVVEHEEVQIPEGWYDGWSIAITPTASM